jgi:hypothetical protein
MDIFMCVVKGKLPKFRPVGLLRTRHEYGASDSAQAFMKLWIKDGSSLFDMSVNENIVGAS